MKREKRTFLTPLGWNFFTSPVSPKFPFAMANIKTHTHEHKPWPSEHSSNCALSLSQYI